MSRTTSRSFSSRARRSLAGAGGTVLACAALAMVAPTAQADTVGGASSGVVVAGGTASAGVAASYRAASGALASIPYPDGNLGVTVASDGSGGHTVALDRRIDIAGARVDCHLGRPLTDGEFEVAPDFSRAVLHFVVAPVAACDDGSSLVLPDTVTWTSKPGSLAWINGPSPSDDTWCLTQQDISLNGAPAGYSPAGVWVEGTATASSGGVPGPSGYGVFWYVYDASLGFGATTTPGFC